MNSDSDVEIKTKVAPRNDRPGRRATSKKINYSGLLDSDEDEDGGDSSDGKPPVFKDNVTADNSDCVIFSESEEGGASSPYKQPPKQAAKAKRQRKQANISSDSDADKKKVRVRGGE